MADISAPVAAAAAAGLTVFGVSTGLDPAILIAGFAGGVWAQSYHPPMGIWHRMGLTLLASILAGYLAPVAAAGLMSSESARAVFTVTMLQLPMAVVIGLTSHSVLGPAVMRFATKKVDSITESKELPK